MAQSPVASLSAIQRGTTTVASGTLNICVGEEILFTAAPIACRIPYEFSVNNVVVQVRSTQSTFSTMVL